MSLHVIVFGVGISAANRRVMQRIGVATKAVLVPVGSLPLTLARRRDIINGVTPIAEVLAYDILDLQEESKNFQTEYSINADGSTKDAYCGKLALNQAEWDLIEDRLLDGNLPAGFKFARLFRQDGEYVLTADHNDSRLDPFVGQVMTVRAILSAVGLTRFKA